MIRIKMHGEITVENCLLTGFVEKWTIVGDVLFNIVWLLCLGSSQCCLSQSIATPLSPEALFSVRDFVPGQSITVSEDGRYAAYVWHDPRLTISERYMKKIPALAYWQFLNTGAPGFPSPAITIRDLKTGKEVVLKGLHAAWAPAWAPTDDRLAFMCDRGGRSALWMWNPASREGAHRITSTALTTVYYSAIAWTSNARSIILASPTPGLLEALYHTDTDAAQALSQSVKVEVRRSGLTPGASAEQTPADPSRAISRSLLTYESDIVRVDLIDGRVHVLSIAPGVNWVQPSSDGRWVAYATMTDVSPPGSRRYQVYYDLWIIPTVGGIPKQLARHIPLDIHSSSGISWAPDSHYLAYRRAGLPSEEALFVVGINGMGPKHITDLAGATYYDTPIWEADSRHLFTWLGSELRRFDIATGEGELVTRLKGKTIRLLLHRGKTAVAYTPWGNDLIILAADDSGLTSAFFRVARSSGQADMLTEEDRNFGGTYHQEYGVAVAERGDRIIFTVESASDPQELWSTDTTFKNLSRISDLGSDVWKVPLGTRRIVEWKDTAGSIARGLLLLPPNYDSHRRYPLVIWMYEKSLPYANTFGLTGQAVFNCQLLATRGIACLYPDLRWEHERVMRGLHEQVTTAIQAMVDQGIADPKRIGVEGQSSGGYDTLAVISTTPTIKAAVACSGFADMMMQYGTESNGGPQWVEDQMGVGSPPWVHPERYIANSPSFHMDQVQTPLLILQGTGDIGTINQMDLTYNLLQHLGKTVEYRRYEGEGHAPDGWSPKNRLNATKRMLDWWMYYLTPDQ